MDYKKRSISKDFVALANIFYHNKQTSFYQMA